MVQSPSFRRLIGELDSAFVIPDEKGIKKVIYSAYDSMLPALINKININAKSVSLTTDMWTARNGQGYIGVTCSYIDAKFNLNEVTLTVTHVRYSHTAKHIMESLDETLSEWKLHEKIFTITTDNAANMKKAISDMKNIEWQGCTAHTLQLVIGKGLVPVKKLITRVKRLIEFFTHPKQSERLEDIQKKYPNVNRLENEENMEAECEQEFIVNDFKNVFIFILILYNIK